MDTDVRKILGKIETRTNSKGEELPTERIRGGVQPGGASVPRGRVSNSGIQTGKGRGTEKTERQLEGVAVF